MSIFFPTTFRFKSGFSFAVQGKSKWSWKEREDDMRELERKNLEQKREIQKLKKFQETAKVELETTKDELQLAREELDKAKEELGVCLSFLRFLFNLTLLQALA